MADELSILTLSVAKGYTDATVAGGGAIKGKNCIISDISDITGGHRVEFSWTLDNGTVQTATMDVMDGEDGSQGETGLGIKSVAVSDSNHLIVTYDDDTTADAGEIEDVTTSFDKITDVDLSNLTDGQILKYNATTHKWENANAGSVDTNLVDLNDVDVENLSDGQIIIWDASAGRWVNADNSASIAIDPTPTSGSENAVSSGGVYTALEGKVDAESGKGLSTNDYDATAKAAVDALGTASTKNVAASGDAATTEVVMGNDTRLTDARTPVSHTHTLSDITDAGTAAAKDSTSSVTSGSTALVESGAVKTAIDEAVSSAYHAAGTKTVAELTSSLLIAANEGNVYNMTDAGTTTSDFIEGSGKPIRIGDNVGVAKVGNDYKFDLLSGFVDTSTFIEKSSTTGLVKNDGTIDTNTYATTSQIPDITGKADKVASVTSGNFAGLDSNGNLTDSGSKASDFLTSHQDISGKADKVASATSGDLAGLDSNGNLTDSGVAASAVALSSNVHNVPSGGTTGQVLAKSSDTNYDVGWVTPKGSRVVELSETNIQTEVGTAKTVTVKYRVAGNSDTATYTSSDTSVATVAVTGHSSTGTSATDVITITPVANGDCTIKIAFANEVGYDAEYDYINVTVGAASGSSVKKTRYTITASSWSASANASGYYTYSLTLNPTLSTSYCPNVSIAGSTDSTVWTATEKSNYDLIEYYNNSATNTLVLYAKTKPTGTFYVWVEGEIV